MNGGIIGPWPYIAGASGIWGLFANGAIYGCGSYWRTVDVPMVDVFLILDSTDDLASGNFERIGASETLHSTQSLPF